MASTDPESEGSAFDLGFLEFSLLGSINAVFYSSLVYAVEHDMGIQASDDLLRCALPFEINTLLGLELISDGAALSKDQCHLLRLTPLSQEKLASRSSEHFGLWQRVFHDHLPDAVLAIHFDRSQSEQHWKIEDSWLVWDWKLSTLERIALSKQANERLEIIKSDPDWFEFTKQAVHDHPRLLAEQLIKRGAMPAQLIEALEQYNSAA